MPVRNRSAESVLELTSTVDVKWTRNFFVEDIVGLTGSASGENIIKTTSSQLDVSHELTQNQLVVSTSNTLNLSHSNSFISAILVSAENTLELSQFAETNIIPIQVTTLLELQQDFVLKRPIDIAVEHNLSICDFTDEQVATLTPEELFALCSEGGLSHSLTATHPIINLSVTSFLQLAQNAVKSLSLSVSSHIQLSQSAEVIAHFEEITSTLLLSHSIIANKTTLLSSVLELTQTIDADATFNRSLSSTIGFSQSVAITNDNPILPVFDPPLLSDTHEVVLTYPFTNPSLEIILRAPEFDNVEQLEFQRINRRSRGGDLIIHSQEYWPIAERFNMQFTNLTDAIGHSLLDFLKTSIGDEIGFRDHENRYWKALVLTPSARLSQGKDDCNNSISLQFEAELAP